MSDVKRKNRMFGFVTETWNPVVGCRHFCSYCWAKKQARRQKNRCEFCYKFIPHIHWSRLNRKFKPNSLVFVCDMADLFGYWVPNEWIKEILSVVSKFPETTFFFETKNPARYHQFKELLPENVILSATIETNLDTIPSNHAPSRYYRYVTFRELKGFRKHLSIEPIMIFDFDIFGAWILQIEPEFVSIGYDNYNHRLNEPKLNDTLQLIEFLEEHGIKVEKKTLRKAWWEKDE